MDHLREGKEGRGGEAGRREGRLFTYFDEDWTGIRRVKAVMLILHVQTMQRKIYAIHR